MEDEERNKNFLRTMLGIIISGLSRIFHLFFAFLFVRLCILSRTDLRFFVSRIGYPRLFKVLSDWNSSSE